MRHRFRRTAIVFLAAAGLAGAAEPQEKRPETGKLAQESAELEAKLDIFWRRVPPCDPNESQRKLATWASKAGELKAFHIEPVAGSERVLLADGRPTPMMLLRLEISGRDPYEKINQFLNRITQPWLLYDLETLRLKAEAGGTVSYSARFAVPCFASQIPPMVGSTPDEILANAVAWQRAVLRRTEEVAARAYPDRIAIALARFGREIGNRGVALTEVRLAKEIVLEGMVSSGLTQAVLEQALKKAGFQVDRIQISPVQGCQKLSVTARLDTSEPAGEKEAAIGNGPFNDQAASVCR